MARNDNTSSSRSVDRYDLAGDSWAKGPEIPGDVGDLTGDASHPWDSCLAPDHVYFLKHHNVATDVGVLARVNKAGAYDVTEIPGMPFNPGMGCAIEYLPASLFADRHERLFVLRGSSGTSTSDGSSWTVDTTEQQLAIYDLVAQTWSAETLPFPVDDGSEMCRVDDVLYILGTNGDSQPLKMAQWLSLVLPEPHLSFRRAGNDLLLTWPAEARQCILESATNLTLPIQWFPLVSGTNQYTTTLGSTSTNRFYRLRSP